jgi:hypothetical protein
MMNQSNLEDLLKSAPEECDRLRAENAHLRIMLGIPSWTSAQPSQTTIPIEVGSESSNAGPPAPEKKIALFRSLFRGREDVYAVRWEGRNGKSGYSHAGAMDWRAIHAARPEDRKKVARKTRMLQPLTDNAIRNHLIGKLTIGIYPSSPTRLAGSKLFPAEGPQVALQKLACS